MNVKSSVHVNYSQFVVQVTLPKFRLRPTYPHGLHDFQNIVPLTWIKFFSLLLTLKDPVSLSAKKFPIKKIHLADPGTKFAAGKSVRNFHNDSFRFEET